MQRFMLVTVFAFCLFLKVSIVAGAEATEVADNSAPSEVLAPVSAQQVAAPAKDDVSSVLVAKHHDEEEKGRLSIVPMVGGSGFNGRWANHISNSYTFGLGLDIPVTQSFSTEIEGDYAKYNITYSNFGHMFDQYSIGANGKFYLSRSVFQPYIGGGIMALYYDNMSYGPQSNYHQTYSQWIGAAQAIAGADVAVSEKIAVGLRGAWVVPVFNRPGTVDNGYIAYPHYEEASAMNTTFFRVMGSARVNF